MDDIKILAVNRSITIGTGCLVSLSLCVSVIDVTYSRFSKGFLLKNLL